MLSYQRDTGFIQFIQPYNFTLRERLALGVFFDRTFEILQRWSKERKSDHPDYKPFASQPETTLPLFTSAFQWTQSENAKFSKFRKMNEDTTYWFVASSSNKGTKVKDTGINKLIRKIKTPQFHSFDSFKKFLFDMWMIKLCKSKEGVAWNECSCTCPSFQKRYICKHVLGIAMKLKLLEPPSEAKSVPIGGKRKRGRPKKSSKALIVDWLYLLDFTIFLLGHNKIYFGEKQYWVKLWNLLGHFIKITGWKIMILLP